MRRLLIILSFLLAGHAHAQEVARSAMICPVERLDHLAAFQSPGLPLTSEIASVIGDGPASPSWTIPYSPVRGMRVTAPAHVFATDPDGGDAVEVELQGLVGDGTVLDGEFVRVGSDRLDGAGVLASSPSADYRFAPDTTEAVHCITDLAECPRFDAVNVYHHVDSYAREFWEDRMEVDITFRAEARVHTAGDGGFADWPTRSMKLGVGNIFMKNSALSDDLIYHEYNHLVMASLGFEIGVGVSEETRALHEAYADYFMATWTDDPRIAEWVVTCPPRLHCEGPPDDTDLRTLILDAETWNWRQGQPSETLKYGACLRYHEGDRKCKQSWNNFTSVYVWGMIWGAALWDVRTAVGAEIADGIALAAVRRHTSETGLDEALTHVMDEAEGRYGPNVAGAVAAAFEQRGFLVSVDTGLDRPESDLPVSLSIDVWPNPAEHSVHLRLHRNSARSQGPAIWTLTDLLGRQVLEGAMTDSQPASIDISNLTSGLYRVTVRVDDTMSSALFLKMH